MGCCILEMCVSTGYLREFHLMRQMWVWKGMEEWIWMRVS